MELTLEQKKQLGDKNPDIQWALDILKSQPEDNLLYDRFSYHDLAGLMVGSLYWPLHNAMQFRPFHARPIVFFATSIGSMMLFNMINMAQQFIRLNKVAVCRKYVILHPEYFPEGRKKFGDLFLTWAPKR